MIVVFDARTDVRLVETHVSAWPPPGRAADPPHMRVSVLDGGGSPLQEFNQWHPLWVENLGDDEQRGSEIGTSGRGRFIVDFAADIGEVTITDIELGVQVFEIDAHRLVVAYCAQTTDASCADVCVGDVDRDGTVTPRDIVAVARAMASQAGDRRWNPDADIDQDGIVFVSDLMLVIEGLREQRC